jgi:signal transduction histidine kinase
VALKSTRPPTSPTGEGELAPTRRQSSRELDVRVLQLDHKLQQLEEELGHERRIGVALREVGLALGATLDLDQLLELILQKITDAVEADRATLYLLDEHKRELHSRIVQGEDVRSIRLKMGQGIAGHVAQTGKASLVNDPYADPRFNPEWDMTSGYRTRSILAVPMKNHLGRTIGVIQVLNKRSGPFTDHDAVVLAALATQAAIAIDNSRLFLSVTQKNTELLEIKEQLEHRVRDLKLLFDLESAMGRATSMEDLFTGVLTEALRATEAFAGAFALKSDVAGDPHLYFMKHGDAKVLRVPMRSRQGFTGAAIADGEVVFTNEADSHPDHDPALDQLLGETCRAAIAVPLEGEDGEAMGAIALYNKQRSAGFSEEDRALLLLIAANASTAVQLQKAREAHEREERLTTIGRLLSGVIHDLKTPLTVISGYVQLMQQADKREVRDEYADLALKQFEHIVAMQRDVLEFARGEKSILIRKVYLAKFFADVKEQLQTQLARLGVELVIELADRGTARFDEQKILRVVHNLARNAAEAMAEKGGKFTIKVSRTKDREGDETLLLTFSDTGPGIPKEIEHRLFQSFVTSGKKGGTGLGLAITKRIAEEHGGTITAHSTSRGATFKLRLPQPTHKSDGGMIGRGRAVAAAPALTFAFAFGAFALAPAAASAQPRADDPFAAPDDALPPWVDLGDVPVPAWARSVAPTRADAALYVEPGKLDARRGSAELGARLPLFGTKRAAGCQGRWLEVGPLAWICSDVADYTADDPAAPPLGVRLWTLPDGTNATQPRRPGARAMPPVAPSDPADDGLPYRYYFAGAEGAYGFVSLARALDDAPDQELEKGFAVAATEERQAHGETWIKTRSGRWFSTRELVAARPFLFHGQKVDDGKLGFGWVVSDKANVYADDKARKATGSRARFERVSVLSDEKDGVVKIGDGAFMRARDLGRPTLAPPPAEAAPGERWIDVDLAQQTLVAYEGARPVFATLVSTGRGPRGTDSATPPGVHRIWVKIFTTKMDNLDKEDVEHHYAIEDVPWVQFFDKAVALHGAFWHHQFGHVHSHGCVNLAPIDARWLFAFTGPHLPAGWTAAYPTKLEPGTIVRVR